jgi:GR25 family glycosyltransferase involved in LPS biosynthesis
MRGFTLTKDLGNIGGLMRTFVISLERTPERLDTFQRLNGSIKDCQVFRAVDGQKISRSEFNANGLCDGTVTYSAGAMGCALSHKTLWELALRTGKAITICEDDAIFHPSFVEARACMAAQLPDDWDLVMWGWNFDSLLLIDIMPTLSPCLMRFDLNVMRRSVEQYMAESVNIHFHHLLRTFGTVCYSVSPNGAQKLLSHVFPIRKMDVFFPGLNKHLPNTGIDIMMNELYPSMKSFVSFPPLMLTPHSTNESTVSPQPGDP